MKKSLTLTFATVAMLLVASPDASAGIFPFFGKKKKAEAAKQKLPEKKPQTPYEKLFKDKKVETAASSFITLH
ncbi:MAG: hypothetical protein LBF55_03490, partial [Prevotellaceae bacterium]|nr:hypothetical protein [Prevotellaceae bacterium]